VEQKTKPGEEPPTYIQVNDFTEPWQEVVNTYGIPNYKTANPGVITSVTFPFVFGMIMETLGMAVYCSWLVCSVVRKDLQ
jgi:V-type H+-transporting ATPase subunit a